jgi:hypothetical protein
MIDFLKYKFGTILVSRQKYFWWLFGLALLLLYAYSIHTTGWEGFDDD